MKYCFSLVLLFSLPAVCLAQYPNFPSKITLGTQTTGDGLIYRGAGAPAYTPANNRNAWVYLDTVGSTIYVFTGGVWKTTGGGIDSTTASNGLTESSNNIKLGGGLTENTSITGGDYGLTVTSTGVGVPALSTQGVYTGVQAASTGGSASILGSTTNSSTNSILNNLQLIRSTTGSAANGIGQSITFAAENSTGVAYSTNEIKSLWSNATHASRTSRMIFTGVDNGAAISDLLTIEGTGQLKANKYTTNSFVGTGWGRLVAQADGTIAVDTTTISGGGGGTVTSITAGVGLTGGTITTSGTIDADTSGMLVSKSFLTNQGYLTTEVDGSVSNEGSLTVGAGTATTSIINSNTSGSTGVTIEAAGTGLAISESGNTITLTSSALTSEVDGSITNEIQNLSYTAASRLLAIDGTGSTDVTLPLATGTDAGLMSSSDFTKLSGIATGAEVNVNADWNAVSGDAQILNKPTISGTNTGDQTSIVGITGTKAQFNTAVTDGDFMYVGDAPTAHTLDSHSNVTITSNTSGEILKWNGSAWVNNTLAEAGIQPAGSYLTSEVDGSISNEGSLTVAAGTGTTSVINSNTSGSTGVTLAVAGTGIAISESGNTITLTGSALTSEVDGSITNEGFNGVTAGGATSSVIQGYNSSGTATGTGVTINVAGTGLSISESVSTNGGSITLTSSALTAEVDGSVTNEGSLTVGAGTSTTSTIVSNTSGSTPVTIEAGSGLTISESGSTITLASGSEYIKSATIESPTATENITLFYTRKAITIREVSDVMRGTSPSVTWQIKYASTRNSGSPTNLFSASRTTTSLSGATTTTFNDATIAAGNWIWLETSAVSGTNDALHISIAYTID